MDEKIKVLYFMDAVGNGGGIQEMTINWLKNMDMDKIQIDILSYKAGSKDNYIQRIRDFGGDVYLVSSYIRKGEFFRSFRDLDEFFRNHNDYSVLHAHASSKALFIMLYARKHGIKTRVLHSHSTQFIMRNKITPMIGELFKPITKTLSTHYFACSTEAGKFLFGNREIQNKRVTVIPNGINLENFKYDIQKRNEMRRLLEVEGKVGVGNIGRFTTEKNHEYLIKIFYELTKRKDNYFLLLVGGGNLESDLKNQILKYHIEDKVRFLGYRDDVKDILQAMDILVMPSLFEGLPVSGVEAQATALPCVFSDTITREIGILEISQFIPLSSSVEVWADAIENILAGYERKNTTSILRSKGFDIVKQSKYLEAFYLEHRRV